MDRTRLLKQIGETLDGKVLMGGDSSFNAWIAHVRSDYTLLPYEGGLFDQPQWLLRDFRLLSDMLEWHTLNEEL